MGCEREGWIVYRPFISYRPFNPQDGVRLSSGIREPGRKVSEYRLLKEGLVPGTETTQIEGCGLEILWLDGWFIVTIRHWVIVVFWLLCYLSLKYFYRKRPVTEPEADL